MSFFHTTLNWIFHNKLLTFLSLTSFIFFVCTVSLGSENAHLSNEVQYYRERSFGDNLTSTSRQIVPTSKTTTTKMPTTPGTPSNSDEGWRLPSGVFEAHSYDLTLRPNLETGLFDGTIEILFSVNQTLDTIQLNSNGLNLSGIELRKPGSTSFTATLKNKTEENEIVSLRFAAGLGEAVIKDGKYELSLNFDGDLKNRIVGLYRSSYLNPEGQLRYIATSKLEPTYARQAFPCFDEPNYKAEYTVHLQIPKEDGYIALSNMNQVGEPEKIEGDGKHLMVHFNKSVPMSTYVSCFIVCDFKYTEDTVKSTSGENISLKVYATPAQVGKTEYALGIAKKVTEYYEKYFGIAYPLPKLDMIAIPDFVSGAMEHWGLVTYRETALLYSKETSNAANKQRIATVVAHELAHMWFGNLVTLNWWNDLWLNEGFATYMQFKSINDIIPDWGMADQFLIDQLHSVLGFDSTLATHPIVVKVTTPNQITEIFDSISYNKGASILRMLENAIGEKKFEKGIQEYLKAHKYGNAVTTDLWKELEKTDPGFDVQEVMDTWTVQDGYPLITVGKQSDSFVLRQTRFLADPENAGNLPPTVYKWSIPIAYFTDKDENIKIAWFNKTDETLTIEAPGASWIKLNHRQVGYYRVNYAESMWRRLTSNFEKFNASDKTNLLEDSFSIAKSGELKYLIPLEMSNKMKNEESYIAWTVTLRKLNELKKFLKSDMKVYEAYQKHVLDVIDTIYKELDWDSGEKSDADHQKSLLRSKVLTAACAFGNDDCKSNARKKFIEWLESNGTMPIDLDAKALVFEYGIERVSKEQWEKVFEIYLKENDASEKLKILNGLASVKDRSLLEILLTRAKNETVVRSQDYFTCLKYISSNDAGTDLVWLYVREHWEELVERFTLNDRYLGRLIPDITSSFVSETRLEEVEAFFKKYPDAGAGEISRKQALETVRNNIKWIKKYQEEVADWLLKKN